MEHDFPETPQVRTAGVKENRASLEDAVLKFENIMFVVGKGKREKIIVKDVSATVTHGRKFVSTFTNRTLQSFYSCVRSFFREMAQSPPRTNQNSSVDFPDVSRSVPQQMSWLLWDPQVRSSLRPYSNTSNLTWISVAYPSSLFCYISRVRCWQVDSNICVDSRCIFWIRFWDCHFERCSHVRQGFQAILLRC
jgi:hypothetical protein